MLIRHAITPSPRAAHHACTPVMRAHGMLGVGVLTHLSLYVSSCPAAHSAPWLAPLPSICCTPAGSLHLSMASATGLAPALTLSPHPLLFTPAGLPLLGWQGKPLVAGPLGSLFSYVPSSTVNGTLERYVGAAVAATSLAELTGRQQMAAQAVQAVVAKFDRAAAPQEGGAAAPG